MRNCIGTLIIFMCSFPVIADEMDCLAKNIYWEARNQQLTGMYAVAEVTLNRVKDRRWPNSVCEVVEQRKLVRKQWICQFSWFCDGLSDKPRDEYNWNVCITIAYIALSKRVADTVPSDTYWYHSYKVRPYWASAYNRTAVIGDHIFYSDG